MKADIYYPIVDQNMYGQITKKWVFDRTIACNITPVTSKEDYRLEKYAHHRDSLEGRIKDDIRVSSTKSVQPITNVLITNIRTADDTLVYEETAGERIGRGTIYEFASFDPFVGAFNSIEFYTISIRRTENQGVDD